MYTGAAEAEYIKYHDEEWGLPCASDERLMEYIVLDGAQCGLSWSTILAKRKAYTEAFKNWDIEAMAKMVRGQRPVVPCPVVTMHCRRQEEVFYHFKNITARAMPDTTFVSCQELAISVDLSRC